jgi:GT2 family glycosyltransferase
LHTSPSLTLQRNQGVAYAEGDVIFFFDDDVVLPKQYIESLLRRFQTHPSYGGGMGAIANVDMEMKNLSDYWCRLFLLTHSGGNGRMQKSGLPAHSHGRKEFMEVEVLSGAAAYRSYVFDDFAFDESLTGYAYMEDVDFSYRVSRQYKLFYDPQVVLEHHHSPLARDKITANREMFLVNHHYLFFKNIFPSCRWCVFCYIWAVFGLLVQALLGRHWQALTGYWHGICKVFSNRLRGRCVLSSK